MRASSLKPAAAALAALLVVSGCAEPAVSPVAPTAPGIVPTEAVLASPETSTSAATGQACATKDPVRLQLKWLPQAQFAGYYAAQAQGYFADACLEVTFLPGGPDLLPEDVVAAGRADLGLAFLPSLLIAQEKGQDLVNIAQIFERSATREISWKASGITSPAELAGKRVAVWPAGNQDELLATLAKYKINKDTGLTLVLQGSDMSLILNHEVDAAAAMTYNELAVVLETPLPDGQLPTLADLNIIDFNEEGTAMLQDGIFAGRAWLAEAPHPAIAERFLRAAFQGWIYCRDHVDACVDATLAEDPSLTRGHQTWMMNEINRLIWPSTAGIGQMDPEQFRRTAEIARQYDLISRPPGPDAYVTAYSRAALAGIQGDPIGAGYQPISVTLTAGGK